MTKTIGKFGGIIYLLANLNKNSHTEKCGYSHLLKM